MQPLPPEALASPAAVRTVLPAIAQGRPALLLLVDRATGSVIYANPLATELTPGLSLPTTLSAWSRAAHLLDADGLVLDSGPETLQRVLDGEPAEGLAVSAALASAETDQREPLWVVSLPLDGAPPPLHAQSLMVFLPLRDQEAVGRARAAAVEGLSTRAVLATELSFTISDPSLPDNPLIWVNPAFTRETGYSAYEVLGTNCRFLQGPDTDRASVARIRDAVREGRAISETLLNYRADGSPFWNHVTISPVVDSTGAVTHFVGVQADVTARVVVDHEREAARSEAEAARAEAEAAQSQAEAARSQAEAARELSEQAQLQLSLLAEATSILAATLEVPEALRRLADLVVPLLGDWVAINVLDEQGRLQPAATAHRDGRSDLLATYAALQSGAVTASSPIAEVLRTGRPALRSDLDAATAAGHTTSAELLAVAGQLGYCSAMYVPLVARHRVLGVMSVVSGTSGRRFTRADLAVIADLGRRAGLAIDNIRLYAAEHATAVTLQRSLLPRLPAVAGLDIAATYLPGSDTAEVGGDWYDVLPLPDGTVGITIGDVMGHDLGSAVAMGQFRSVLRAYAWEGGDPASVLDRVDRVIVGLDTAQLATCLYGRLELGGGDGSRGTARLTYASAGHPSALLRRPDGRVEALDGGRNLLLGIGADGPARTAASVELMAGSSLVMFTDGLVEDRTREIDVGVEQVASVLRAHDGGTGSQGLVDALTAVADDGGHDDDVCILAITLT